MDVAIVGAKVYPAPNAQPLTDATVVMRDGKVVPFADLQQRLTQAVQTRTQRCHNELATLTSGLARGVQLTPATARERLRRAALRLELLDPKLVLQRGFAWLSNADGQAVTSVAQTSQGQALQATLADGVVDLRVAPSTQI